MDERIYLMLDKQKECYRVTFVHSVLFSLETVERVERRESIEDHFSNERIS